MADPKSQQAGGAPASASANASNDPPATQAEYKKSQQRIRELIRKKAQMESRLNSIEDTIAQKELGYLENTQSGNIITGFDNYMKGQAGAAAQRKKTASMEQNRIFSKSSISYKPNQNGDATPGSGSAPGSNAPTPLSASFKDGGSAHATPTSAGGNKNTGRNKKKSVAGADVEDSETDSQANRKRTNFGASRK